MKPTAPPISLPDDAAPESSLASEIARVCETKARDERRTVPPAAAERPTIPAPPSPETLKAATPCPPAREENHLDTIPSPPPPATRKRDESDDAADEPPVSTIPGAPRVPDLHSM